MAASAGKIGKSFHTCRVGNGDDDILCQYQLNILVPRDRQFCASAASTGGGHIEQLNCYYPVIRNRATQTTPRLDNIFSERAERGRGTRRNVFHETCAEVSFSDKNEKYKI